jgi:hypothetical protein
MPLRNINWWLAISASAGVSRVVIRWNLLVFIRFGALEESNR